jgi:hypothetical protein
LSGVDNRDGAFGFGEDILEHFSHEKGIVHDQDTDGLGFIWEHWVSQLKYSDKRKIKKFLAADKTRWTPITLI